MHVTYLYFLIHTQCIYTRIPIFTHAHTHTQRLAHFQGLMGRVQGVSVKPFSEHERRFHVRGSSARMHGATAGDPAYVQLFHPSVPLKTQKRGVISGKKPSIRRATGASNIPNKLQRPTRPAVWKKKALKKPASARQAVRPASSQLKPRVRSYFAGANIAFETL
jgi:hypothetical protein